jgi:hypothetical protein
MNNLPEPDPAWDYSQLYVHLLLAKESLDRAIAKITPNASRQSHKYICTININYFENWRN